MELQTTLLGFSKLAQSVQISVQDWNDRYDNAIEQLTENIAMYHADDLKTISITFGDNMLEIKMYDRERIDFRPVHIEQLPALLEICRAEWNAYALAHLNGMTKHNRK
jgi:hypothetical protein